MVRYQQGARGHSGKYPSLEDAAACTPAWNKLHLTNDLLLLSLKYDLYTTQDVLLAHLRVDDKHVKLDLRPQVGLPSTMCDGIVAAIVFMSIMKDEWLEGANLKLS